MPQTVDLAYLSIAEAGALFRRRELSPVELVNALLDRSERLQETLVPYVTLTPELARQQARTAESASSRVRVPHRCWAFPSPTRTSS
jgi:Asp-tRNA(Asn)/Glu-tRNA(Gln) amidotransferase A subunit family amidase